MLTLALVLANVTLFLVELGMGDALDPFLRRWGLVASDVTTGDGPAPLITLLTSMFLHAGWLHLLFNMLYLVVFGLSVERRLGTPRFALLYVASGLTGNVVQLLVQPGSTVPAVGASGAIAGLIGAHLMLFPGATLGTLAPGLFFQAVENIPALVLLLVWVAAQLIGGLVSLTSSTDIAWWAHLGGFAMGVLLAPILRTSTSRHLD